MGIINKLPVYSEKIPGGGSVLTSVEQVFNQARAKSLWYLLFGTACCAIELMCTGASRYDFDRLGMIFRATPRQSLDPPHWSKRRPVLESEPGQLPRNLRDHPKADRHWQRYRREPIRFRKDPRPHPFVGWRRSKPSLPRSDKD